MTVGLIKAILPISKPTSREKLREGKHTRIHYVMHGINSKWSEKKIIGAIVQGFTCLFPFATAQSSPLFH
jgi:hypothetical protein